MADNHKKARILIVEDEVLIATDLEYRLNNYGYEVCGQATSAEKALELVAERQPDLVMMDIVIKGDMDGIDTAAIIKNTWSIPVVFLTAYADTDRLERAKLTYPFGYLLKPFQDKDLKITVDMAIYAGKNDLERRRAEENLKRSEERLSIVMEGARIGFWDWNVPSNQVIYSNIWLDILGYDLNEVSPDYSFWESRIHHDDKAATMQNLQEHLNGRSEIFEVEHRLKSKSGQWIWVLGRGSVRERDESGSPVRVSGVMIDITKRRQAEEALIKSEQQFRMLVEKAPIGIIYADTQGNIIDVNPKLINILGSPSQEATRAINILTFPPLVQTGISEKVRQCLENGIAGTYETTYLSKWGRSRFLRYHLQPLFDEDGRSIGVLSLVEDISLQKEQEQQLRQAHKMEAIGTLTSGVSHDFNNLLLAINGTAQLLLLDKTTDDPEYESLKTIEQSGRQAVELVRQLLLFSRNVETERESMDLNHAVEQIHRLLKRTIPKMIDIELKLDNRLWTIEADAIQIEQVLLNLGTNAADAMPDGGRLFIETQNTILDKDNARNHFDVQPGHYVQLTVSDTGSGMDRETREKIFEPFFTTKGAGEGNGLGLSTVYGIVRNHGGYITCYSEIGLGATFKVYLPAVVDPDDEEKLHDPTNHSLSGSETILVVDDEEPIRSFASKALQRFGYSILTASSGEDALAIYSKKSGEINLVILDIGMPGMGGHKCLQELLRIDPDVNVLIASGYSADRQAKKSVEGGATAYIPKPYQLNELLKKIRSILNKRS